MVKLNPEDWPDLTPDKLQTLERWAVEAGQFIRAERFTDSPDVRAAAVRVARAWLDPGPVPAYHVAAQKRLLEEWPVLAHAVNELSLSVLSGKVDGAASGGASPC